MYTPPKTTIWRSGQNGLVLVSERNGLPSPVPRQGEVVFVPGIGETICSGLQFSGKDLIEVALTIR